MADLAPELPLDVRKRRMLTRAMVLALVLLVAIVVGGRLRRPARPPAGRSPSLSPEAVEALDALRAAVDQLAVVRAELRPARLGLDAPPDGGPTPGTALAEALAEVTATAQPAIDAGGGEAASALVLEATRLQADGAVDLALATGERALATRLAAALPGDDAPRVRALVAAHTDPATAGAALAGLTGGTSALDVQEGELAWARARAALWSAARTPPGPPPRPELAPAWDRLSGEALALGSPDPAQAVAQLDGADPGRAPGLAAGVAGVLLERSPPRDELLSALVRLRGVSRRATARPTLARPLRELAEQVVGDAAARGDLAALVSASLAVELAAEHDPEAVTLIGPCHAPLLRVAEAMTRSRPVAPLRDLVGAAAALLRLGDLLHPGVLVASPADDPRVTPDDDPATRVVLALLRARGHHGVDPEAWRAVVAEVDRALEGAPPTVRAALLQARAEARDALGEATAARGDLEVARALSSRPADVLDRLALWHLEHGPPESGPSTATTLLILASAEADDAPPWPPAWPPGLDPRPAWRWRRAALAPAERAPLDERLRSLAASLRQAGANALAEEVEAGIR